MFSNKSTSEKLSKVVSFLSLRSASQVVLGASVRLSRTQGYPKAECSRCEHDHHWVLGHHLLLSYFLPPAAAGGAWGPNQLLPSSTPRDLTYLGWERVIGRCYFPAPLGDCLPLLWGHLLPSPRTKLLTELASWPQQPCSCLH